MVFDVIMSVPENVWDAGTVPVPVIYTSVIAVTSWLLLCSVTQFYTPIYRLNGISRKKDAKQNVQSCILFNNNKNITFTGVDVLISVAKKDWVYCIIFRNYLCLLNSTRQSWLTELSSWTREGCGHRYACPITPCTLGHQAVPRLASGPD